MDEIAVRLSFILFAMTFFIALWEYFTGRSMKYATVMFILAITINLVAILSRAFVFKYLPFTGRYQALILYVFTTSLVTLFIVLISDYKPLILSIIPLLLVFLIIAMTAQQKSSSVLAPVLKTPLFGTHIILVFLGYAFYTVNFGLCFFIMSNKKDVVPIINRVTELGSFLIGAGIAIGAVWAALSWGNWWAWDPKETWALITFLIYILYLHLRNIRKPSKVIITIFLVTGFASLIITFLGINVLKWSIHSY